MEDLTCIRVEDKTNILILTNHDLDEKHAFLYSLLKETDALITDLSSIHVDYILIDRLIGFTIDDLGSYKTGYIFEDPIRFMPGEHMGIFRI